MLHQLTFLPSFAGWQTAARRALAAGWPPPEILWQEATGAQPFLDLAGELEPAAAPASKARVPKTFMDMATRVSCHADPARWDLLYRALWRMTHDERHLLELATDPDTRALQEMDKAIRRDLHKMRAFVRFRAVKENGLEWFVAWFEPQHHIVELNAPFFVDRFAGMCWSILTPDRCAHWDKTQLTFTPGLSRDQAPTEDATESLWLKYYANIFNPARVKVHAMQKEMPKLYWKNLPEAAVIPGLLQEAPARVTAMIKKSQQQSAGFSTPPLPESRSLPKLRAAAAGCKACPLWRDATQTVFGEGPPDAEMVFVGEQPGDAEDRAGHPFIGPAGQLLDRALQEAGLDRSRIYVTNAVKHFKFEPTAQRRLHKKPSAREVAACCPWLEAELELLKPRILVCLGSTAAQSVFGRVVRVLQERGKFLTSDFSERTFITVHPSSLLRAPDAASRERDYKLFLDDLRQLAGAFAGKN
jgi:DNA polymerase